MTHPIVENLIAEIASADRILAQPSGADPTLRALLEDRFYVERQMAAIRDWLPKVAEQLAALDSQQAERIAELEAEVERMRAGG